MYNLEPKMLILFSNFIKLDVFYRIKTKVFRFSILNRDISGSESSHWSN